MRLFKILLLVVAVLHPSTSTNSESTNSDYQNKLNTIIKISKDHQIFQPSPPIKNQADPVPTRSPGLQTPVATQPDKVETYSQPLSDPLEKTVVVDNTIKSTNLIEIENHASSIQTSADTINKNPLFKWPKIVRNLSQNQITNVPISQPLLILNKQGSQSKSAATTSQNKTDVTKSVQPLLTSTGTSNQNTVSAKSNNIDNLKSLGSEAAASMCAFLAGLLIITV